jgi:hypothetical protein
MAADHDPRAAVLRLLRARQAEMQGMIDAIMAWVGDTPAELPPKTRRKRPPKPEQPSLL